METSLQRRALLGLAAVPWALLAPPVLADGANPNHLKLVAAWRTADDGKPVDHVGILSVDWAGARIAVESDVVLESRAHGLWPEADGGCLVVATRPGRWLMRLDPAGQVGSVHRIDGERPERSFGGHVLASPDGRWLFTSETDVADGSGWISVRDARTFRREAAWPTHGLDPHQMVLSPDGQSLMVANGGIPRSADGRKRDLHAMDPSLVKLDIREGRLLGQWRLPDPRLSIRHLAWNRSPEGWPWLGVALQAEHDDAAARREAPILALWEERQGLRLATRAIGGAGYAGDISAGPAGGFVLSAQRTGEALLWHPDAPDDWITIARVTEPCALAAWPTPGGVLMAAARGMARRDTREPAAMLPWPQAMNPDNHWVVLA